MFDFGIGASELLFIAIVALIVVGPKDLPRLLRTIGQYSRKIRGLAREFQTHLDEASREAGLDEVKKEVKGMTNFTVTSDLDKQGNDIKRAIEGNATKSSGAAKPASGSAASGSPASGATGNGKATTAVEDAIAESEAAKPDKPKPATAKPETAKSDKSKSDTAKSDKAKTGTAKTNNTTADTAKPDTGQAAKPKPAAKPKAGAKAKPQSGRSHEQVKS